jgi:TPR repeat protein
LRSQSEQSFLKKAGVPPAFCVGTRAGKRLDLIMHASHRLIVALLFAALPFSAKAQGPFPNVGVLENNLRQQAEAGDPEAQFQLGVRLAIGEGLQKNGAEGVRWLEKAADGGHVKAMHALGALHEEGQGVKQDFGKAALWYGKAAEKELPDAQFSLAMLYQNGRGVKKDLVKATELAQQAAAQGFSPAQAFYASKLVNGDGVAKNPAKGALWFLKAAKQDHPYAQRQLAYLYYTGNGVPVDYERCLAWYRRAAKVSGDPWAKNDLAWFLSTCPEKDYHRGEEAAEIAKDAIMTLEMQTGEQRHEIIDTMAAALARNGQFAEAMVWQKRSLKLLEQDQEIGPQDREKLQKEFEDRLKLYQADKAYADKPADPKEEAEPLYNDSILEDENSSESPERSLPRRPEQKPKKNNAA